jgi:hypothetical protein
VPPKQPVFLLLVDDGQGDPTTNPAQASSLQSHQGTSSTGQYASLLVTASTTSPGEFDVVSPSSAGGRSSESTLPRMSCAFYYSRQSAADCAATGLDQLVYASGRSIHTLSAGMWESVLAGVGSRGSTLTQQHLVS